MWLIKPLTAETRTGKTIYSNTHTVYMQLPYISTRVYVQTFQLFQKRANGNDDNPAIVGQVQQDDNRILQKNEKVKLRQQIPVVPTEISLESHQEMVWSKLHPPKDLE